MRVLGRNRTCVFAGAFLWVAASSNLLAESIIGSYYFTNGGQAQSTAVFSLLSDNRFMFIEDGNPFLDPSGQDGLEKGTYTWDSVTGAFSVNTAINTNGEWGLCSAPLNSIACALAPGSTAFATSTALTFTVPGEGSFAIPRLSDPLSPIVGAWYFSTGPNAQDLSVVSFLPNGKFMIGIDPPANGYIEFGGYTWNSLTGQLSATMDISNAPLGSSVDLPSFTSASVANGSLVLSSSSGALTLGAVAPVPEPSSLLLVAAGFGGMLLVGRLRRSKAAAGVVSGETTL